MFNISSLSFCGGGSEACGSLANHQNRRNNIQPHNVVFENTQNSRPYVSKQFTNAFDFGAFGLIKNITR